MMRRLVLVAAALAVGVGTVVAASSDRAPVSELEYVIAEAGDSYFGIAAEHGLSCNGTALWAANGRAPLDPGTIVFVPPSCTQPASTTTTTLPPATTVAPTTSSSTTTTTTPPVTSVVTTTTAPPTTTTAPPTTTTEPPATSGFIELFDDNEGLERFDYGIYHRGSSVGSTPPGVMLTWPGDHGHGVDGSDCGDPTSTSRTINRDTNEWIYVCRNHMMTAIGDTDGYSVGWFAPKQTFTTERTVSWDVNVTDLLGRQWWEMSIVPADFDAGPPDCPQCSGRNTLAAVAGLPVYPDRSVIVGNQARGFQVWTDNVDRQVQPHVQISRYDPEGAASKAIRRTFSVTDNGNGTITVNYGGFRTFTVPGSFPDEYSVVFKDHNYTPNKDGIPAGYTWHWDSISVN